MPRFALKQRRATGTCVANAGSDATFRGHGYGYDMMQRLLGVALVSLASRVALAEEPCDAVAPWSRLDRSVKNLTQARPLVLGTMMPISAGLIIPLGFDHTLRVYSQTELGGRYHYESLSVPAPYVLFGTLLVGYGTSAALSACEWQRPQAAMIQAMALTAAAVSVLKISVGRQWPNAGRDPSEPDRLRHPEFATDFTPFRRFGAWPSGHTASLFSAAAALRTSAKSLGWLAWIGYPFAVGVGVGMAMNDRHWVSDIVAGALLGEAIGSSVGQSFAPMKTRDLNVWVMPTSDEGTIVGVAGVF